MGAPAHSRDPFGPVPFGHEEILRGPSKKAVRDGALVLQAAGIQHAIQASGAGARIVVGLLDAERARAELGDYLEENQAWPPLKERPPSFGTNGLPSALLFAAVIAVMHWMQYRGGYGVDWTSAGRMEGGAVASGEGWRARLYGLEDRSVRRMLSGARLYAQGPRPPPRPGPWVEIGRAHV